MGAPAPLSLALASRLADAGADVALTTATADPEEAFELRRAGRIATERGRRALIESVDLGIGTGVQVTVRQVARALGPIDVLIVAPDVALSKPAERLSDAEWARIINTNLGGAFYACRAAGREMLNRARPEDSTGPKGRIIIVNVWPGEGDSAASWAAKAALSGLASALEREWAGRGVSVHLLLVDAATRDDPDSIADSVMELLTVPG